jgi:hypothetical protein
MTTARWMLAALGSALAIVLLVCLFEPPGHRFDTAMRVTARWSLLWFTLATTGSALTTLFGPRFQWLAQRGRDFGLAFASAHLVHVALVVRGLYVWTDPFPRADLAIFGLGVAWVYLLALVSLSGGLRAMLSAKAWRTIRSIGVEYIAFVYLCEIAARTFRGNWSNVLLYLPFLVIAAAGPLLRFAALVKRSRAAAGAGLTAA